MQRLSSFKHAPELRQQISANLSEFKSKRLNSDQLKGAAVALTIFQYGLPDEEQAALVVTKRTPRLKAHSGQWALPGGRIDAGESQIDAALREMSEEVNLKLPATNVLGLLDDYVTRSGYVITPVVVWSDRNIEDLHPNPDEVASIHAFSFNELNRQDSPNLETIPESDRQVLSMNYLSDRIYSPTAAMLYQFREVCLLGNNTRVAHFDQPLFAWK